MNKQPILLIALLMIPAAFAATLEDSVWPIGNSTASDDINDAFGPRLSPGAVYDFHRGIDFLADEGTPIAAVMNGTVVRMETAAENNGTGRERFGNWVCINHTGWPGEPGVTRMTTYFHMSNFSPTISEGTVVTKGDIIGFVGHSGEGINTNHLHLELHRNATGACSYSNLKAKNAMRVLPYTDQDQVSVSINDNITGQYRITVSLPADQNELDFNRIEIIGTLATRIVDYELREGIDPANNDNPSYNGVTISPANYTHTYSHWNVTYNTTNATIGVLQTVKAYDAFNTTLATVTYTPPTFLDDFANFNAWTESGESDWRPSVPDEGQIPGFPTGNTAAEADDCDTNCTLTMTNPVDLSGKSSATVKFWRLVDNDIDTNEYLKIDAYNGTWNQIFYWTEGSGDDELWHYETWNVPSHYFTSNFKLRFVTKSSTTAEEVEVDELRVETE